MKLMNLLLMLLVLAPPSFAAGKQAARENEPVVWGMLSQNTGCVIFKEGHKTKGMYWGVAVTTKRYGKLTAIESQNYDLGEKEIVETQENMDDLMQRARRDHVKFVKIPEKYAPDLLNKARAMCTQGE